MRRPGTQLGRNNGYAIPLSAPRVCQYCAREMDLGRPRGTSRTFLHLDAQHLALLCYGFFLHDYESKCTNVHLVVVVAGRSTRRHHAREG